MTSLQPSATPMNTRDATEILLAESIHPAAEDVLVGNGLRVRRHNGALSANVAAEGLAGIKVVGIRSKSQIDPAFLTRAGALHAIGCFCIGTNQVDLDEACRRGIAVFNAPFSNTRSVAEMTIAEIISLHRRLFEKSMAMHQGQWDKSAAHAHEVRGRVLGIVGYGHIGSQVSVLAEALGMRVVYHDIIPKLPLGNATPLASLGEVLAQSDVVTLHVPETVATKGMVGANEIGLMPKGAFLINNARGTVIDQVAVADALRSGHLGGYATDVHPAEPSASKSTFDSPLVGIPNAILTPHVGGSTEEAQANIAREVADKLTRYMLNGTTTSAVNVPEVELPQLRPNEHRILHFHHNVPGVLSKMHAVLADLGVNINAEYLQSTAEVSYVILDVSPHHGEAVREGLSAIPETIRVRTLY